jgi:hypothetical protein
MSLEVGEIDRIVGTIDSAGLAVGSNEQTFLVLENTYPVSGGCLNFHGVSFIQRH